MGVKLPAKTAEPPAAAPSATLAGSVTDSVSLAPAVSAIAPVGLGPSFASQSFKGETLPEASTGVAIRPPPANVMAPEEGTELDAPKPKRR